LDNLLNIKLSSYFYGVIYLLLCVILSIYPIRLFWAWLCNIEKPKYDNCWDGVKHYWNSRDEKTNWFPCILGTLELIIYPVLMIANHWNFIGAWLGFKTIAQWSAWKEERHRFNKFLIVNIIVIVFAFLLAILNNNVLKLICFDC
jgi:hypothetical protein